MGQGRADLIAERETAATTLREQIAALTGQLAGIETEFNELAITRTTLLRMAGEAEAAAAALDATVTSGPYQQVLAVFTAATSAIRAKDVCLALDTDASAKNVEKMRARLKRLVARQILAEPEPGLFTLAHPNGAAGTIREQGT
ncbi:MAG: hypothetical protein HKP61_19465 [Dactylosporangium sp.]|nr:hypothetical protein [Dactylosporangium sp.]NNJ63069.1 hypothetical protein [Dactylosporangium sp.]